MPTKGQVIALLKENQAQLSAEYGVKRSLEYKLNIIIPSKSLSPTCAGSFDWVVARSWGCTPGSMLSPACAG